MLPTILGLFVAMPTFGLPTFTFTVAGLCRLLAFTPLPIKRTGAEPNCCCCCCWSWGLTVQANCSKRRRKKTNKHTHIPNEQTQSYIVTLTCIVLHCIERWMHTIIIIKIKLPQSGLTNRRPLKRSACRRTQWWCCQTNRFPMLN